VFGQIWPPKPYPRMWRVFLHHDWIWRKNGSKTKTRITFSTHKQKFTQKIPLLGVQCIKCVCYIYVSLRRYDFVVKLIKYGRREVKIIWPRNNRCHMSHENVIKLIWSCIKITPMIPDSYGVLRFPEQGLLVANLAKHVLEIKVRESNSVKRYINIA